MLDVTQGFVVLSNVNVLFSQKAAFYWVKTVKTIDSILLYINERGCNQS